MAKPYMEVTYDGVDDFNKVIKSFKRDAVLVGIPESDNGREISDGRIGNAALLFINNFGSTANNIPPRPVMQIGIFNAQDAIADEFANAAKSALDKGISSLLVYYNRIGTIASNSIKRAINDQIGFDGPAESTLKSRKANGFNGTKSLIVTGQMRNAITYVIHWSF